MKKIAFLIIATCFMGCNKSETLSGKSYQLIPLEQNDLDDRFVILKFVNDTDIEILTTTDILGSNNSVIHTHYNFSNNILRFQGNVFETKKNKKGYDLHQSGKPAGKLIPSHEIIQKSILESPSLKKHQN